MQMRRTVQKRYSPGPGFVQHLSSFVRENSMNGAAVGGIFIIWGVLRLQFRVSFVSGCSLRQVRRHSGRKRPTGKSIWKSKIRREPSCTQPANSRVPPRRPRKISKPILRASTPSPTLHLDITAWKCRRPASLACRFAQRRPPGVRAPRLARREDRYRSDLFLCRQLPDRERPAGLPSDRGELRGRLHRPRRHREPRPGCSTPCLGGTAI